MPEPIYSIKLFYGDMKFTNDYSNVLQFDNKTARDTYFDSLDDTIEKVNTETNRVMFDGGSIKLVIDTIDLPNLDKINYCYINYALVGQNDFVQYRKYYFVISYNIVSSCSDTTVVEFVLEYDIWQNNQFDFSIKESNIERMHVDRWNSNGTVKYTRPQLDAIESNAKVINTIEIEEPTTHRVYYHSQYRDDMAIVWVMVTAIHTLDDKIDQMLYHFIPVVYESLWLTFNETDPANELYYTQNAIKLGTVDNIPFYFPSLQALDSAFLHYACGNNNNDKVNVVNVQFFNWLPLKIVYENDFAVIKMVDDTPLKLYAGAPYFPGIIGNGYFATYGVADLSQFSKLGSLLEKRYLNISGYQRPRKPVDGYDYSAEYEPALYTSPVIKRYITLGDISASVEIPDIMYIKNMLNTPFAFKCRISFSAISAYSYFTIGTTENNRVSNNGEGFALIKPSYLGDLISDAWKDYITTQRDSDRAMMWTNIITGGISEAGSTAVSAGIGWRSNAERARISQYAADYNNSQSRVYDALANSSNPNISNRARNHYASLSGDFGAKAVPLAKASTMYAKMGHNAMFMSGIGGVTAFSANAIHQSMAQRQKERSIMNTPGTLAKAGNAIASIIDKQFRFSLVETIVDDISYEKYKLIFMKYGYYIGNVELPNIKSRKFFNYIKTNGAVLIGSCNQLILSYLANIFDNGVTIWHMDYTTYATIYDYTKENIERSLM